jgi:acyl-coenzyme A thioesterase 13
MAIEEDIFDIAHIAGNASDEIKQTVGNPGDFYTHRRPHEITSSIFGESIAKHLKVTEISIKKKEEEERKLEARMVFEIDVTEGEREFIE